MLLLYSMYSFNFTFLGRVKAISMHRAHRLLSESTLILCTLRNGPGGRGRATSPDREMIPEAEYFDCRKMSGNPAEIKAQCEPTEPTEGPTDFPRMRRL